MRPTPAAEGGGLPSGGGGPKHRSPRKRLGKGACGGEWCGGLGGGGECGGDCGVLGRRRRHRHRRHSEQRSGVVTVFGVPLAHSMSSLGASTTLASLLPRVLTGRESVCRLEDLAEETLASCPASSSWGEECEMVASCLYTCLMLPPASRWPCLPPHDLVSALLEKWVEGGGEMEFPELLSSLRPEWKCGAALTLFLLCANLVPERWASLVLKADFTAWGREWLPGRPPPPWLLEVTAIPRDLAPLTTLLKVSVSVLQGLPPHTPSLEDSYLGSMTRFLCAASLYKEGKFQQSLDLLQNIPVEACEEELQGWVSWLMGLGLAKLEKPHTALVKLQAAVDHTPAALQAMANIAQVFHSMENSTAELAVLQLLVMSAGHGVREPSSRGLHSALLYLHHTPAQDLRCRALFLYSCRCLQAKKYDLACKHLHDLLSDLASQSRPQVTAKPPRSLLRPEDTLQELPALESLLVLMSVAHLAAGEHSDVLDVLRSTRKERETGSPEFYQASGESRARVAAGVAGGLLWVEALKGLGREKEALTECIRLEQSMWWVSGSSGDGWGTSVLQLKTVLYSTMSALHQARHNAQNQRHHQRLARQCLDSLGTLGDAPVWQDASPHDELVMDVLYGYFKSWLS